MSQSQVEHWKAASRGGGQRGSFSGRHDSYRKKAGGGEDGGGGIQGAAAVCLERSTRRSLFNIVAEGRGRTQGRRTNQSVFKCCKSFASRESELKAYFS